MPALFFLPKEKLYRYINNPSALFSQEKKRSNFINKSAELALLANAGWINREAGLRKSLKQCSSKSRITTTAE